jgi:hypothetical protein
MTLKELFAKYQQQLDKNPQFEKEHDPDRWVNIHAMLAAVNELVDDARR